MSNHCLYVWKNVVPYSKAKEIYIVAHSAGGYCLVDLVTNFQSKFIKNVIKMALTDSAHGNYIKKIRENFNLYKDYTAKTVNFVESKKEAGAFLSYYNKTKDGTYHLSSGHEEHIFTSGCAINEVFKFFFDKNYLKNKIPKGFK